MSSLGQFWYQSGSPYSLRAYWAILHSGVQVQLVACIPLLSTFLFWIRSGMRAQYPVSLPLLIPAPRDSSSRPLRDSFVIARAADTMRALPNDTPSLFPPHKAVEIDKAIRWSDTVAQYGRTVLCDAILHDPELAARVLLPSFICGWVFVPFLLRLVRRVLIAKYPQTPSKHDMVRALESFRALLSGSPYVCGDSFSYGDICMASSMYFAIKRRPGSPASKLYNDAELTNTFQDLVSWRERIFERHCPLREIDAYKCLPIKQQGK